jgi:endonuclease YncB( thermonuclease family)
MTTISDPYHTHELMQHSFTDLPLYTLDGVTTIAKVTDVYDGDTVTIVFYLNDQPVKHKLRLYGYDTPELKPLKTTPCRDLHIQAAKAARSYLKKQLLGNLVWVKFCREDKYGRLMGTVYLIKENKTECMCGEETDVNQQMIGAGYAKAYDGGHKTSFCEDELKHMCAFN